MFKIHTTPRSVGWEYLPASAVNLEVGDALIMSEGKLTSASGNVKPTYIAMCDKEAKDGDIVPVIRVSDDIIFETVTNEDMSAVKIGSVVNLDESGKSITSQAGNVAEIVDVESATSGSIVKIRFI